MSPFALVAVMCVINLAWTTVLARHTLRLGKAHDELDRRAEQFDLEDADLIERRRLLDAAELRLAADKAQFAKLVKQANGHVDIALHNLNRQMEQPKLEVPGQ